MDAIYDDDSEMKIIAFVTEAPSVRAILTRRYRRANTPATRLLGTRTAPTRRRSD